MSTAAEYLTSLRNKGVVLWVDDGQLHYQAHEDGLTAAEIDRLRALKPGLVELLRKEETDNVDADSPVADREVPLTFQQEWLDSLARQHPGWNCVLAYAFRLTGRLDINSLRESLAAVMRSHDSLRGRIVQAGDVPMQRIESSVDPALEVISVEGTSAADIEANARLRIQEFATRRFDLSGGPLVAAGLLRLADQEHILMMVFHRLFIDCSSVSQVFRELWSAYARCLNGEGPNPPAQSRQYADYAVWQRSSNADWQHRHGRYWTERLAQALPIHWPADAAAAQVAAGAFETMECSFDPTLSGNLRDLAKQARTLAPMVMLSAYATVVSRWCGQSTLVVPFNIAGRHTEHQRMVGLFSHVLYLRVDFEGSETFMELLKKVSGEFYRAVSHQDFGRMSIQQPGLLAGTFLQWLSWHPNDIAGLAVSSVADGLGFGLQQIRFQQPGDLSAVPPGTVDIEITFYDAPEGIYAAAIYRADLFTAKSMTAFMRELRSVTGQLVDNPQLRLAEVAFSRGDVSA